MYLDKKQVAERFGISVSTVNNYMREGMPYYKIGAGKLVRFNPDEIEKWIKEHGLIANEFVEFSKPDHFTNAPFKGWHNKKYLRVCMANLYEKHIFGIGKSRITDEEWARLCDGYEKITGEQYEI